MQLHHELHLTTPWRPRDDAFDTLSAMVFDGTNAAKDLSSRMSDELSFDDDRVDVMSRRGCAMAPFRMCDGAILSVGATE